MLIKWLELDFTEYRGKSLPQIIFDDPYWFLTAVDNDVFKPEVNAWLTYQALLLRDKSRIIRPRSIGRIKPIVEYHLNLNPEGIRFSYIRIVSQSKNSGVGNLPFKMDVIDWGFPRMLNSSDKAGTESIVKETKLFFFGGDFEISRGKAEEFFDDERNFRY